MKKILHIITDSNIGGAGHYLLALIDEADGRGLEISVALPEGSRLCPSLAERGVSFYETAHIAERSLSAAGVIALYKLIKKIKPEVVHTHASLSGRIAARLAGGCKIIHTKHWALPSGGNKFVNGVINNLFSDVIIAISPAAKESLLSDGTNAAKVRLIVHGIPPTEELSASEREELRRGYNVPKDKFAVAQAARLTGIKGQDDVLNAAKLPGMEDVLFLLAGDGEDNERLRKRVADENITNVRMLGFVEKIGEIFNIMDAQICPSRTEAVSLALLSGMSVGKPAVAANCSGIPFIITHGLNGLLFAPRNAEAIRDAVLKLKNDSALYAKLSDGARREYAKRFTVKRMAAETLALYEGSNK